MSDSVFNEAIELSEILISDGHGLNRAKIINALKYAKEIELAYAKLFQESETRLTKDFEAEFGFTLKIGSSGEWVQFVAIREDKYLELMEKIKNHSLR